MELALYCPIYGYYEKEGDNPGRKGDFYTGVSVGPLFGQLLGFQFAEWITEGSTGQEEGKSGSARVQIVEAGAHDGCLAADLLNWIRERRPALFERLEYIIAEPSARWTERQRRQLAGFPQVRWVKEVAEAGGVRGVIFSNELLDAMPVHRYAWDATKSKWFEWGVTNVEDGFEWVRMNEPIAAVDGLPVELSKFLPDGFTMEASPRGLDWWKKAAGTLEQGRLLTLDYGFLIEEMLEKTGGTLRAYQQHRVTDALLDEPGTKDLTAHVNFTQIVETGERAGLQTEWFGRQEQFLTGIAARTWKPGSGFGEWSAEQRREFQTLSHPEHLGRFKVLVQRHRGR